jgi:hypothetical protein
MAQMIPEAMPPGSSIAEKRVFDRLQQLDDDCIVYYEPPLGNRYPDFLVIIPDAGLLVVEMKGWLPYQILGGDTWHVRIRRKAHEQDAVEANPIRQAREYMYRLMDQCRRHPAGKILLHADGPHEGRFRFPFGFCAVLSQVTDEQLRRHASGNLRTILPEEHVVAADEFEKWPAFTPAQLRQRLATFFDPRWAFPRLTVEQVNAIRAIVSPQVLVPPTPTELAALAGLAAQVVLFAAPSDLRTLDVEQERSARSMGTGHRLLFGVPGSGKTVVLVARATYLSEALPGGRILVLCFNVTFMSYLRVLLRERANVDVFTFHGWSARNGVKRTAGESPEQIGQRLLDVLQTGEGDAGRYDAVLIDEAQDFDPSWFQCALQALKEPRGGDLLIVGDRNQKNYSRRHVSWAGLGIKAQGRTRVLKVNYRNTAPIVAVASPYADDAADEDGLIATRCEPAAARRRAGTQPILIECQSRDEEAARIERLVRELLSGSMAGADVALQPPLAPSDIGILYRERDSTLDAVLDRLRAIAPVVWLNRPVEGDAPDPRQDVVDPGLKVQTIHSAKGLQYRAVVLVHADQLGARADELERDVRLLYVALTRPEELLAVTYTRWADAPANDLLARLRSTAAFRRC